MSYQVNEKRKTYDLIENIVLKDLENTIADWNGKGITIIKTDLTEDGYVLYGNQYLLKNFNNRARGTTNINSTTKKINKIKKFRIKINN